MTSTLEELFAFQATAAGLPAFEREVCVIPGRKFRFDFCWRPARLLVEINGGTYTKAAHSTGGGIARDYEKIWLAQKCGWHVYPCDGNAVKSGKAVKEIQEYLEAE